MNGLKPADVALIKALAGKGDGSGSGTGVVPNIQMTATPLPAGSEPTVTRSGSNANPVFNLGIPAGEHGKPGDPGKAGGPGPKGDPGKNATINGLNAVELVAGENVSIQQDGDKVTISAAGGGGPTYVPGDGITIEDDVLSVTTPVQGILTQAEYDALPEEERNRGMYVVDDGQSSVSGPSMEVYDGEEQVIGTWFGKPLYRKVFRGTTNSTGAFAKIINVGADAVIRRYEGMIDSGDGAQYQLNSYSVQYKAGGYSRIQDYSSIMFETDDTKRMNKPFFVIVEYTKNH